MFAQQSSLAYLVSMAFGSDDLTPYTAQYAWNSNQMAHAMMGFCLAVCWLTFVVATRPGPDRKAERVPGPLSTWACLRRWFRERPMWLYVLVLFGLIPLKELADILLDRQLFAAAPVRPTEYNLLYDSLTDTSFWWAGMFLAAFVLALFTKEQRGLRRGVPLFGLVACAAFWLFHAGGRWQNQKQTFDASGMPFNYTRLAVLSGRPHEVEFAPASPVKWPELETFREEVAAAPNTARPSQRHFVIYGGNPAVRSKLAVSLGCEYAFKLRANAKYADDAASIRVMYLSAIAALERPEVLLAADGKKLECVVIDDLDVTIRLPSKIDPDRAYNVYKDTAALPHADPRSTAPSAEAKPSTPPQPQGQKGTVTLPKSELNKYADRKKVSPPASQSRPGNDLVDVQVDDFQKLAPTPQAKAVDPVTEAREELAARSTLFKSFGAMTKPQAEGDAGISTIWVLAGLQGKGKSTHAAWITRRDAWVAEIADILGVPPASLKLIELADPTTPGAAP